VQPPPRMPTRSPFGVVVREFDRENVNARLGCDLKRLLSGRAYRTGRNQQAEKSESSPAKSAHKLAFTRPKPKQQSESRCV